MSVIVVNTTSIENNINTLNNAKKYFLNKKNSFSSNSFGSCSNLTAFLSKLQNTYEDLSSNIKNVSDYLSDYKKDIEAVENKLSKGYGSTTDSYINILLNRNANSITPCYIDEVNIFQTTNYVSNQSTYSPVYSQYNMDYITAATTAVCSLAFIEGILNVGETLIDGGAMIVMGGCSVVDYFAGTNSANAVSNFIEYDWSKEAYYWATSTSGLNQYVDPNCTAAQVCSTIGNIAGNVGLSILTGSLGSSFFGAGTVAASRFTSITGGVIGGLNAAGGAGEEALMQGASDEEALTSAGIDAIYGSITGGFSGKLDAAARGSQKLGKLAKYTFSSFGLGASESLVSEVADTLIYQNDGQTGFISNFFNNASNDGLLLDMFLSGGMNSLGNLGNYLSERMHMKNIDNTVTDLDFTSQEITLELDKITNTTQELYNQQNKTIYQNISFDSETTIDIDQKFNNAKVFSDNFSVAEYFNDPKEYLYGILKQAMDNESNTGDMTGTAIYQYLVEKYGYIATNKDGEFIYNLPVSLMDENELYLCLYENNFLNENTIDMYKKLQANSPNFTKKEIDAVTIFTKYSGPALAAFNRKSITDFRGHLFNGQNIKDMQGYLTRTTSRFNYDYKTNISHMELREFNGVMDGLIGKDVVGKGGMIVERGIDRLFFNGNELEHNLLMPGQIINDAAHMSTSLSGANSSTTFKQRKYNLKIYLPEGTPCAYLDRVAGISRYGQHELLLGRNSDIKITHPPIVDENGNYTIKAELISTNNIAGETVNLTSYSSFFGFDSGISGTELIDNMKNKGLWDRYQTEVLDIYNKGLYDGVSINEHDYNHIKLVILNSMYMGDELGLSSKDMDLLVEAAKYHDSGLKYMDKGKHAGHADDSARVVEESLKQTYSSEDISIIKSIIEYHEPKMEGFDFMKDICNKNGIYDEDKIVNVLKLANILKDADGLDRARFPGNLDTSYYRNSNLANKITKAEFDLREEMATMNLNNKLNDLINSGKESDMAIYHEIQSLRNTEMYPDFIIDFATKYYLGKKYNSITDYVRFIAFNKTF